MGWCFPQQSLALLPCESGVMFTGDNVCSADRLLRVAQAHGERISNDCGAGRRSVATASGTGAQKKRPVRKHGAKVDSGNFRRTSDDERNAWRSKPGPNRDAGSRIAELDMCCVRPARELSAGDAWPAATSHLRTQPSAAPCPYRRGRTPRGVLS